MASNAHLLVYFWCADRLVGVIRTLEPGADPYESGFELLRAGPTDEEVATGLSASVSPKWRASVEVSGRTAVVDYRGNIPTERFLAGLHLETQAVERTLRQFPEIDRVTVTLRGKSLCALDPECAEP